MAWRDHFTFRPNLKFCLHWRVRSPRRLVYEVDRIRKQSRVVTPICSYTRTDICPTLRAERDRFNACQGIFREMGVTWDLCVSLYCEAGRAACASGTPVGGDIAFNRRDMKDDQYRIPIRRALLRTKTVRCQQEQRN